MKQGVPFRFGYALAILALALCPGCWQEVQYVPSEPAETTLISSTTSGDEPASKSTPSVTSAPVEVTPTELFAPESAAPSDEEPTRVETPPAQSELEPADLQPEPETPAESVAGSSAELPKSEIPAADATSEKETETPEHFNSSEVATLRPSRTALAAWRTSSRWSLAAAVYAKGQPEESYRDLIDQANYAASLIDMELPRFPTTVTNELQTTVANYLLHEGSEQIADELRGEYPIEYAALAEFAIKSHALLLIYTPKSQQLEPVVESIHAAATNSGLPANYYETLIDMLERRDSFADVKAEVLAMHASIGDYLSGE
jgi:hypothetical protein